MAEKHIKTGEEIRTQQGMMFDNYHTLSPEEAVLYKEKSEEKWVTLAEFNKCLDILEDVIVQCCTDESVKDASIPRLDSMARGGYADALRFLAKHDRVTIVSEYGRRVIASLNHKE